MAGPRNNAGDRFTKLPEGFKGAAQAKGRIAALRRLLSGPP